MGSSTRNTNQTQYQNQTTQSAPWAPAQAGLQTALQGAQTAYDTTYNRPSVAALDPLVTQGQNQIVQNANNGMIGGLANRVGSNFSDLLANNGLSSAQQGALGQLGQVGSYLDPYASGKYLQAGQNPYLDSVLQTAQDKAAAGVNSQFSAAGRYGSGAQNAVLGQTLGDIQTNARMQDYNQQQQNQLSALQQLAGVANQRAGIGQQGVSNVGAINSSLGALNQNQNADASALLGVGGQRMDYNQAVINAANQDPWTRAQNLAQIAGGIGGLGGTSNTSGVTQTNNQQSNNTGIAGAIGAGTAGLGAATNLANGLGNVGGWSGMFSSLLPLLAL
jgi:hypothetical protein